MRKATLIVALVLIAVLGLTLHAYAADQTVTVTGRTNAKITLTVDNATVAFGTFDPDTPQTVASAFTATVKSNKGYDYYVTAPSNFAGGSTPAIDHLEWDAGSGYAAFASGNNDPRNGEAKTSGRDYAYGLRLTFGYDEDPDVDYSADIVPTAMQ